MKLTDTLTGTKRDFTPLNNIVTMYVCGPNLYGPCHVGHALSFIVFDVLKKYLLYRGYEVNHVQNFTDIEDRIIETSNSESRSIKEISEYHIDRFLNEMDALRVMRANAYPKATDYINEMINMIEKLIDKGIAYNLDGDVYYRVERFPNYGSLSRRSLDEMESGTRIEVDERKENPSDFALWKSSKSGEPAWPSPWGDGRPGWHIECSAMSISQLGDQFDIHGGGHDVVFPHHENEIAQSEGFSGKNPVVNYWLHNGLLRLSEKDTEKMTRHQGNFVSLEDAIKEHSIDALRIFLLSSHYRSPRIYSTDEIHGIENALSRVRYSLETEYDNNGSNLDVSIRQRNFIEAMDDDLNTPRAIAEIFELSRDINKGIQEGLNVENGTNLLRELGSILGLTFENSKEKDQEVAPFIELLIELRKTMREKKYFAEADLIRDKLTELNIQLEDTPDKTKWKYL